MALPLKWGCHGSLDAAKPMLSNALIVTQVAGSEREREILCIAYSFLLFLSFVTRRGSEVRGAPWEKALWAIHFYSILYIFTNLHSIWSRARLRLSDIWFFFHCFFLFLFCFVLFLCVCVADFQFVKSIFASCCLHLCSLIRGHCNLKNLCVPLPQKRRIKMDGSKTRGTKNFLFVWCFFFFFCCRCFFFFSLSSKLFVLEFDVMIVVNRFVLPFACRKPVSPRNPCLYGD